MFYNTLVHFAERQTISMEFDLTRDESILIYGCGKQGLGLAKELKRKGYKVKGYIDKRGKQLVNINGLPVFAIEDIDCIENREEYIVIISIASGMEHENIAKMFSQHGMCKLIYLHMNVEGSYQERQQMRKCYKSICNYCFEDIKGIPIYNKDKKEINKSIYKVIDNDIEEKISFWCPISYINNIKSKPYLELYKWLNGESADIEDYLFYVNRTEESEQWLKSRKDLYEIYLDALKYDTIFFTDAPSPCKWDDGGYFCIQEGMTRANFLVHKGYEMVPVVTSREDYNKSIDYIRINWRDKNENI